jgi:hypothetical protein
MLGATSRFMVVSVVGCFGLAVIDAAICEEQKPRPPARDMTKRMVERPVERLVSAVSAAPAEQPAVDGPKAAIEGPTRRVVAATADAATSDPRSGTPKVEPGMVHWHPRFADACQASQKTGKPVLLFWMMGKLDEPFC